MASGYVVLTVRVSILVFPLESFRICFIWLRRCRLNKIEERQLMTWEKDGRVCDSIYHHLAGYVVTILHTHEWAFLSVSSNYSYAMITI